MKKDLFKIIGIGTGLIIIGFFLRSVGITGNFANAGESHLTFKVEDGLILHAWLEEAAADSAKKNALPGLVLLLPMMSHTHESYDSFARALRAIGYTTLAFDMRGHGQSTQRGDEQLSFADMGREEFARMPADINDFFQDFKSKHPEEYNYSDVVVIGASIGANTAGLLLLHDWVARSVLLSPGRDYRGLEPGKVMLDKKPAMNKPVYIAAALEDTYSAESSQWLFDNYEGGKVLKKYPGQDHGTDILIHVLNADKELLEWLKK